MNDEYSFLKGTGRRRFIKGGGSLVALGSLPAYLTAKPERLVQPLAELQQRRGMVLYRDNDTSFTLICRDPFSYRDSCCRSYR